MRTPVSQLENTQKINNYENGFKRPRQKYYKSNSQ